jgi:hydroxymethylbilane synthase
VSSPLAAPVAAARLGTRRSPLARRQTELVVGLLTSAWSGLVCDVTPIDTSGDRTQETGEPLPEIGGKGLFTAELERALRMQEIDIAVHSLKDLPTESASGIVIGAICMRDDVRDCLVARDGLRFVELPTGALVGTSSLRRSAQLRSLRPELEVRSIRGNVDTRIRKVREGDFDAVVLAVSGVLRLELEEAVTEWFSPEDVVPAPGQGALALQCRDGDESVLALSAAIDDAATRAAVTAERAFLQALGGGCAAPVGAYAVEAGSGEVRLDGLVASPDGRKVVRVSGEGSSEEIGERLAREALAAGADAILRGVRG